MGQGRVAAKMTVELGSVGASVMKWLALSATMANLLLSMAVPAASQDAKSSFPNRPAVLGAPADGHAVLAMSNSFHLAPLLMKNRPYDPLKDFAGIGFINSVPSVLTVGSSKPDRTIQDLIARAKANPGTVSYASGGIASSTCPPHCLLSTRVST